RDIAVRDERHRGWVSVMRGCNHRCSYCIVPATRGRQWDRTEDSILDEVRRLADDGASEIFLLGQNINTWGRTLEGRPTLDRLLERVHEVDGVRRIRFLTSNPMDLETALLDAMGDLPRVMPYLHFPAQSGSDEVLRRMFRGYTRERYLELVGEARTRAQGIELATDLIVGFPGETDAEFEETMTLMDEVRWAMVYCFKYSVRPGTKASEEEDDVPDAVKKERNQRVLARQAEIQEELHATRMGAEVEILVDGPGPRDTGRLIGRTEHHQIGLLPEGSAEPGDYVRARVVRSTARALYAEPLETACAAAVTAEPGEVE
ncbi:MAG: MiaB/RimO family radical SAM methylthiotransferase, partial [Planctomycetota bacterium]